MTLEKQSAPVAGTAEGAEDYKDAAIVSREDGQRAPGASLDEWIHFDLVLGLTEDLLPVVSNRSAQISPNSKISEIGKTPSRYNASRLVTGIAGWPGHRASQKDLDQWASERDYGICVITREVRAIDVDISDVEKAARVRDFIAKHLSLKLPCRCRANSGKFLHPFRLAGELGKRIIHADGGSIEFLMTGQQFIAAGTHSSGVRYEWEDGLPDMVPSIPLEVFEGLFAAIQKAFGTRPPTITGVSKRKTGGGVTVVGDEISDYLLEHGRILGTNRGGLIVACPWEHEHTMGETGDGRTLYYPAGTNGDSSPGFKCLHAHCADRKYPDFVAAIGFQINADGEGFEDEGCAPAAENPLHQFYAYLPDHKYIHRPTRRLWPAASVDGHLAGLSVDKKKPTAWLDKHRAVQMLTWWPGREEVIADMIAADGAWIRAPGQRVYNQYRAPAVMSGNARQAMRWRDHLRFIYPDEAEASHVEKWLAQRVQAPGVKVNHALVLGGAPGIGKDTLLEPVKRAVGSWNWSDIDPSHVLAAFSPWMKSVVLRVNETRDLGGINRFAFYEHTKTLIAAPPDMLLCNEKHVSQYHVVNVMGVIYTTNNKTDGIYLPANDRRHFVAWSSRTQEDFDADYWPGIWSWLDAGGDADVATFLRDLDLSSFDPKAPPPKTPAFFAIVAANNDPRDSELAGVIEEMGRPDAITIADIVRHACGATGVDGSTLIDELTDRKNRRGVPHLMERAGYAQVRNPDAQSGLWRIAGNRCAAYARNDLSPGGQLAAARELTRNHAQASA